MQDDVYQFIKANQPVSPKVVVENSTLHEDTVYGKIQHLVQTRRVSYDSRWKLVTPHTKKQ